MKITDDYILSLDIFDTKGRLKAIAFNKILNDNSEIKKYLENRYNDKFIDYKTVLWRIRNNISYWPKCPTCGKLLNNLKYIHCSTKCSSLDPKVKKKNEKTTLKNHGVKNGFNIPKVKKKAQKEWKKAIIKKYGSIDNWRKANIVKINQTKLENAKNSNYYKKIHKKEVITKNKHRQEDPLYDKKIKEKEFITKKKNGTLNTSKQEEQVYKKLLKIFSIKDIYREYSKDLRYSFHCDFYIKSLDLFIECNFHWTHGGHWFNKNSIRDQKILQKWKEKSKKSDFYKNAIKTWTVRDIEKQKMANKNKLNYIVFWNIKEFENYNFQI